MWWIRIWNPPTHVLFSRLSPFSVLSSACQRPTGHRDIAAVQKPTVTTQHRIWKCSYYSALSSHVIITIDSLWSLIWKAPALQFHVVWFQLKVWSTISFRVSLLLDKEDRVWSGAKKAEHVQAWLREQVSELLQLPFITGAFLHLPKHSKLSPTLCQSHHSPSISNYIQTTNH